MEKRELVNKILEKKALVGNKIHQDVLRRLNDGIYPLHENGALPELPDNVNYNEVIYTRYAQLYDQYLELFREEPHPLLTGSIVHSRLTTVNRIEQTFKSEMEQLSIEIIKNEFSIGDEIEFDVELLKMGDISKPPERNDELDVDPNEWAPDLDEEIRKRVYINALTQGASLKGHYIFNMYSELIEGFNPQLTRLYRELILANDVTYFITSDVQILAMAESDEGQAGYVKVTFGGEKPKIEVKAVAFPILIHELIKGVMEVLSTLALPEEDQKDVMEYADNLGGEIWGIRLGPTYWENLMHCIDLDDKDILKNIIGYIYKLPTDEFNELFREINLQSDTAKLKIAEYSGDIRRAIAEYEEYLKYLDENSLSDNDIGKLMSDPTDEADEFGISDDDLDALLSGDSSDTLDDDGIYDDDSGYDDLDF